MPTILYHATASDRVPGIMQHGLGGAQRKNFDVSRSNVVYLSDNPDAAESYAVNGLLMSNPDSTAGITILQIDSGKLDPALVQSDRNHEQSIYGGKSFEYRGVIPPEALSVYYVNQ